MSKPLCIIPDDTIGAISSDLRTYYSDHPPLSLTRLRAEASLNQL